MDNHFVRLVLWHIRPALKRRDAELRRQSTWARARPTQGNCCVLDALDPSWDYQRHYTAAPRCSTRPWQ